MYHDALEEVPADGEELWSLRAGPDHKLPNRLPFHILDGWPCTHIPEFRVTDPPEVSLDVLGHHFLFPHLDNWPVFFLQLEPFLVEINQGVYFLDNDREVVLDIF